MEREKTKTRKSFPFNYASPEEITNELIKGNPESSDLIRYIMNEYKWLRGFAIYISSGGSERDFSTWRKKVKKFRRERECKKCE